MLKTMSLCQILYISIFLLLGAGLGPPGKPPQLDDSFSPYNLIPSSESPTSPLVPPDSWGQGKSTNDKMANGTNINWPPGNEIILFLSKLSWSVDLFVVDLCYVFLLTFRVLPRRTLERPPEYRPRDRPECDSRQRSERTHHKHEHPRCQPLSAP